MTALDIRAVADALGIHKSVAFRHALKQGWSFIEEPVRGGRRRLYPLASLPANVQAAVARQNAIHAANAVNDSEHFQAGQHIARKATISETVSAKVQSRIAESGTKDAVAISGSKKQRMQARIEVLSRLDVFANQRRLGICVSMQDFCDAYGRGDIHVPVQVRQSIGPDLCPMTLRRWRKTLKKQGAAALGGEYGNRAGTGIIDVNDKMRDLVLGILAEKPHVSAKMVYQAIEVRFSDSLPSPRSVARFMSKWKSENAEAFMAVTNPDAWKNRHKAAFGKLDEGIDRINQRWAVDSTPGDIQLIDGRYNILGSIDLATRRAKLHVAKTSSAEAVSKLLRKCLLSWGVAEQIKMDNGRDYASNRVQRALKMLDIQALFSAPFSPWEKPHIERLFRTFSHGLLEMLPGFVGHNVAEAQELRASKSFADRLFKKNTVTELKMTAAELQSFCDQWCDNVYAHAPHDGLNGDTPFQRAAALHAPTRVIEDIRALDILLSEVPDNNGVRTVGKKGIKVDGHWFIAPDLALVIGRPVQCFYHDDLGRLVVYHNEAFLCIAENPEIAGISRQEVAVEASRIQNESISAKRRELKALARKAKTKDIVTEILVRRAEEASTLSAFPSPNVIHMTPALEAASEAANALEAVPRRADPTVTELEGVRDVRIREFAQEETANDRFKQAMDYLLVPAEDRNDIQRSFLKRHCSSSEFMGRFDIFEGFGPSSVGLDDSYLVLMPDGAFYYRYIQLKNSGEN